MEQPINTHPTYLFDEVAAIVNGTLAPFTHYAIGRNGDGDDESGIYIRFFCKWLPLGGLSVYQNEFWRLPKEWDSVIKDAIATGKNLPPDTGTLSKRENMEKSGKLKPLPIAANIVKYQLDPNSDKTSLKRWRFYAIYNFFTYKDREVDTVDTTPKFNNVEDCLQWALSKKAFLNRDIALAEYNTLRATIKPQVPSAMYAAWMTYVNGVLKQAGN